MAGGRKFPLDGAFAELREEVEKIKGSLSSWREDVSKQQNATVKDTAKQIDSFLKFTEVIRAFKEAQKGLLAGGTVARALGLDEAAGKLERMARRIELIGSLTTGIVSAVRGLRVVFLPVVGAVTLLVAAMVGVQQVLQRTTGVSVTLKETFQLVGLFFKETFQQGRRAFLLLKAEINGFTPEIIRSLNEATAAASATRSEIDAIADAAARRPPPKALEDLTFGEVFENATTEIGELATAAAETIDNVFTQLDQAIEQRTRRKGDALEDPKTLTPFQNFQAELVKLGDVTQGTFDFIAGGVQQLSATISTALLDAFLNPQADIRDSFAQLFKALAQQLLQLLIQALVVRTIAGIGGFGDASGKGVGLAAGGEVPSSGTPSLAHFMRGVRGLAFGGRPAGIPASDTVPAWLTPGEYVHPLAAVREYGVQAMEAIRRRLIPAPALRALAAGVSVPSASIAPGPRGYATGGTVTAGGSSFGDAPAPVAAFIVPSEQSMDRQLTAGKGAMLRFLRENRSQYERGR